MPTLHLGKWCWSTSKAAWSRASCGRRRNHPDAPPLVSGVRRHPFRACTPTRAMRQLRAGGAADPCFGTTHADYFNGAVPVTRPADKGRDHGGLRVEHRRCHRGDFPGQGPARLWPAVLVWRHGPFCLGSVGGQGHRDRLCPRDCAQMAAPHLALEPQRGEIERSCWDGIQTQAWPSATYGQRAMADQPPSSFFFSFPIFLRSFPHVIHLELIMTNSCGRS